MVPVIPWRSNVRNRPRFFPKAVYKLRVWIEQMIGRAKRFKRLATRGEKTASNDASIVALVCEFILIKSVRPG